MPELNVWVVVWDRRCIFRSAGPDDIEVVFRKVTQQK